MSDSNTLDGRWLSGALAWRLLSHSANRFARFVTWVSFVGLALGVMVLTVVITVMNGFDRELKDRLLRTVPHITIADQGIDGAAYRYIKSLSAVERVHTYFQGLGALSVGSRVQPVSIYALDDAGLTGLAHIADHMRRGDLADLRTNRLGLILGEPLARHLGLQLGDAVTLVAVENGGEGIAPKLLKYELVGTFALGAEPDYSLALVHLARQPVTAWQRLGDYGLQVQLSDPLATPQMTEQISSQLPDVRIDSWDSTYGELFAAVKMEKTMMFLLLFLVVAIASFNIIAGQTMIVNDKRGSIAILLTMGGKAALIKRVFLLQGLAIGLGGTLLGLVLGLVAAYHINSILAVLQDMTGMHLLDGSFFVEVPVQVQFGDLLSITLFSCGLSLLSAWSPARRAAQLDPIQNLH